MYRLIVEIDFSEVVHIVVKFGLDDIVGNHRVEHLSLYLHSVVHQHLIVVLQVLSYLENFLVLIGRSEDFHNFPRLCLVLWHRNVKCLVFLH